MATGTSQGNLGSFIAYRMFMNKVSIDGAEIIVTYARTILFLKDYGKELRWKDRNIVYRINNGTIRSFLQ